MTEPKFEGIAISLGGTEYVVPPLSVGQIRRLWPVIQKISTLETAIFSPDKLDLVLTIVHASFSRNYPEMTKEVLEDLVDLRNVGEVIRIVMESSGFSRSGEKQAGSGLTGTPSTSA